MTTVVSSMVGSVRPGVIGEGCLFDGPYGTRRPPYADYTDSGRPSWAS